MSELLSFETLQRVVTERDRLADQVVRDRELLQQMTAERDALRARLDNHDCAPRCIALMTMREERDAARALVREYVADGVVFFDCENATARQDAWIERARALLKDGCGWKPKAEDAIRLVWEAVPIIANAVEWTTYDESICTPWLARARALLAEKDGVE